MWVVHKADNNKNDAISFQGLFSGNVSDRWANCQNVNITHRSRRRMDLHVDLCVCTSIAVFLFLRSERKQALHEP